MTIQERKSKVFVTLIKNQYLKGQYDVEYAIEKLEEYKDKGKIIATDYSELYDYLVSKLVEIIEPEEEQIPEEPQEFESVGDEASEN